MKSFCFAVLRVTMAALFSAAILSGVAAAGYQVGDTVADFHLKDTNENRIHLTDFNRDVILLNFWSAG